jgi:hypothetical protein
MINDEEQNITTRQDIFFLRYVPSHNLVIRKQSSPLKILVVTSSPKDTPYIDTDREIRSIEKSLEKNTGNGSVILDSLRSTTIDSILDKIRDREYENLKTL